MPWPKGKPRPEGKTPGAGRKKGTPNKSTLKCEDVALKHGCDPYEVLIMFAKGDWKGLGYAGPTETRYSPQGSPYEVDTITRDQRLKAAQEASQYIAPKRKAIDHSIKPRMRHEVEYLDGTKDVFTNEEE